jgi:hypothetical protein
LQSENRGHCGFILLKVLAAGDYRAQETGPIKMVEILYSRMKMEKLFQEWGGRNRRLKEWVNSTIIYCKNFGKCHNVFPVQ